MFAQLADQLENVVELKVCCYDIAPLLLVNIVAWLNCGSFWLLFCGISGAVYGQLH